jgi:hypothetical protein
MDKALTKRNARMDVVAPASPTPLTLLEQAVAKGVDLDQMQKLMDLQERWEKKEAKKAFLDALARFQNIAPVIKKTRKANINSQKGSYSYKFADLGAITGQIKEALKDCGLSYRWEFQPNGNALKVTCFISHRDGHTETTSMEAGKDMSGGKNDIQQIGSTQTYLQRYTLIGALGLSTADEDNDGRGNPTSKQQQPEQTEEEYIDQWQQAVKEATTRVALNALYLKNKKAVDGNEKVKAIFKGRQQELPVNNNEKPELP